MEFKITPPQSVDHAVENLTGPLTQRIGATLSSFWDLMFGGVEAAAKKKQNERNRKVELAEELSKLEFIGELRKRLEAIPPDKRSEPDTQIVGNALMDLRYCMDKEELREMFLNLLTSSCHSDTADDVLPSYSDIIRRMTVPDACNLKLFAEQKRLPIVHYQYTYQKGSETALQNVFLSNPEYTDCRRQAISISALERFGLLKVYEDTRYIDKSQYDYERFRRTDEYFRIKEAAEQDKQIKAVSIYETFAEITPFGEGFSFICLPEKTVPVIPK